MRVHLLIEPGLLSSSVGLGRFLYIGGPCGICCFKLIKCRNVNVNMISALVSGVKD